MLTIDLNLTYKCNFRCEYCFEEKNLLKPDMEFDKIIHFGDEVLSNKRFKNSWDGKLKFVYWGGEPTLKMSLIKDVIDHYKQNKNVFHFIYTNGFDIDELIELKKKYWNNLSFQISYDGFDLQNKRRIDINGNGTADLVRNNIIKCIDADIPVGIKSVIQIDDIDHMVDSYKDFVDLNNYNLKKHNKILSRYNPSFTATRDVNCNEWDLTKKEKIDSTLESIYSIDKNFYKEHGKYIFTYFTDKGKTTCGMGMTLFAMDVDGNIYTCHGAFYFDNKEDHYITNIYRKPFVQDLEQNKRKFMAYNFKKRPSTCNGCDVYDCFGCSIINYLISDKNGYVDKLRDYGKQPKLCYIFKKATEIRRKYESRGKKC